MSGKRLIARYTEPDLATVYYDGYTYRMSIAVSGSGARYVGDGLEWWSKGSGTGAWGMLLRHESDGSTPGERLDVCEEI